VGECRNSDRCAGRFRRLRANRAQRLPVGKLHWPQLRSVGTTGLTSTQRCGKNELRVANLWEKVWENDLNSFPLYGLHRTWVLKVNSICSGAGNGARTRDLNFGKSHLAGAGNFRFSACFDLLIARRVHRGPMSLTRLIVLELTGSELRSRIPKTCRGCRDCARFSLNGSVIRLLGLDTLRSAYALDVD
jgi:hypothetical protein